MESRTIEAYRAVFDWLLGNTGDRPWRVERFICDFERALHNVIVSLFGRVNQ